MLIPEKYRERYDNLDRSHPWMREMRDADDMPEGDAVSVMRKVANSGEVTGKAMRNEVGGTDWADAMLILADMVERDYVLRGDYDFMVDMLKAVCAERDEWKAKAEQLANDSLPAENNIKTHDVDANDANAAQDTREKLEEDVLKHYTHTTSTLMWPDDANIKTKWVSIPMDTVLEWLDRQASITDREILSHPDERDEQIAELQQQADDLRDEWHRVCAERANLARDLGECMADRDRYRALCGQMLDAAHEIRRIADANMPEVAKEVLK